jgi:hypothetical protein
MQEKMSEPLINLIRMINFGGGEGRCLMLAVILKDDNQNEGIFYSTIQNDQ